MPIDYLPILILVIITTAFACLALIVPTLLGPRKPTKTKLLPYESGKIPFGDARRRFPVKYYLTANLWASPNENWQMRFTYPIKGSTNWSMDAGG